MQNPLDIVSSSARSDDMSIGVEVLRNDASRRGLTASTIERSHSLGYSHACSGPRFLLASISLSQTQSLMASVLFFKLAFSFLSFISCTF